MNRVTLKCLFTLKSNQNIDQLIYCTEPKSNIVTRQWRQASLVLVSWHHVAHNNQWGLTLLTCQHIWYLLPLCPFWSFRHLDPIDFHRQKPLRHSTKYVLLSSADKSNSVWNSTSLCNGAVTVFCWLNCYFNSNLYEFCMCSVNPPHWFCSRIMSRHVDQHKAAWIEIVNSLEMYEAQLIQKSINNGPFLPAKFCWFVLGELSFK